MKSTAQIIVLLTALFLTTFLPGCSTTGTGTQTGTNVVVTVDQAQRAARAATIVETSAQLGTYYAIRQDGNTRAYFEAAVVVIGVLENSGTFDPASVQNALKNISVKELRSEEVSLAVAGAVALYSNFFGETVSGKLDQNVYVKPVLVALKSGITKGLSAGTTERSFGLPPKPRVQLDAVPTNALVLTLWYDSSRPFSATINR